jgi:hypothetical protein
LDGRWIVDTWVWILLAVVFGVIVLGSWWSVRWSTPEDRESLAEESKNSGGNPSGWLM